MGAPASDDGWTSALSRRARKGGRGGQGALATTAHGEDPPSAESAPQRFPGFGKALSLSERGGGWQGNSHTAQQQEQPQASPLQDLRITASPQHSLDVGLLCASLPQVQVLGIADCLVTAALWLGLPCQSLTALSLLHCGLACRANP
jgi:hypothetical protein